MAGSTSIIGDLAMFGPEQCASLDYAAASAYTRNLTRSHYENFTVVSWMLPRQYREDFQNVYAFCRWADDLGDETGDPAKSLELLDWWRRELDACYAGRPRHPVFVALQRTIANHEIPRKPFDDLIDAFIQDQTVTRYDTWEQVVDYCTRSANPVGRLVLYVCGYRDEERQRLSDSTCTALQLANFWQDVRRDILERDRVYIPQDAARRNGLDIDTMIPAVKADASQVPTSQHEAGGSAGACGCSGCALPGAGITAVLPEFKRTIHELTQRTQLLFVEGRKLLPLLRRDVRVDIELFNLGGEKILQMIRRQNYDTLTSRPALTTGAKMGLMARAVIGKILSLSPGSPANPDAPREAGR